MRCQIKMTFVTANTLPELENEVNSVLCSELSSWRAWELKQVFAPTELSSHFTAILVLWEQTNHD
jgi:hypothetical protein